MKKRIFYSWQSDLPNNTNRGFINNALEKAIAEIHSDDNFSMIPFLDRDTVGLTGSPDISASIFKKIDDSTIFVCDVSIINELSDGYRLSPNPNVLIELGYAISKIGWSNIILIMNEHFGGVENLPFDLRGRKVLTYSISSESDEKASERKKVSSILQTNIRDILTNPSNENPSTIKNKLTNNKNTSFEKEAKRKLKVIKNITYVRQKNEASIKETERYLKANRYDLAVDFALNISYARQKNEFLIQTANFCIKNKDYTTAEKAINGITYVRQKNELSMKLLKIIS